MFIRQLRRFIVVLILSLSCVPMGYAQFAVIDVGAIAQLIEQVAKMEQQLVTAQNHLRQAQQEFQSISGTRGMERLLSGTVRNYLPSDWAELDAAVNATSTAYHALSQGVQEMMELNAVLTPARVARMSSSERTQLDAARRTVAQRQTTTRMALQTTSARFASIQQLIDAIPGAGDQKAILDLHARIAAEQGMLANEQTKLQVLYQAAEANELARQQKAREQAISDVGSLRELPPIGLK